MDDLDKLYRDQLIDRLHVAETNCRNAEACWRNAERDLERVDRKWDKALAERDEARAALEALRAERDTAFERGGAERVRERLLARATSEEITADRMAQQCGEHSLSVQRFQYAATVLRDEARALVKLWEAK